MNKSTRELDAARTAGRTAAEAGRPPEENPFIFPTTAREGDLYNAWEGAWTQASSVTGKHEADAYDAWNGDW